MAGQGRWEGRDVAAEPGATGLPLGGHANWKPVSMVPERRGSRRHFMALDLLIMDGEANHRMADILAEMLAETLLPATSTSIHRLRHPHNV